MALYHSAKGTVDYTIVGSPTIIDGVASGFSSSDYVKTEDNLPTNITSLQIHTEAIKANSPSVTYGIFMINGYPSIEFQGNMFRIYVLNQDGTNTPYGYQGKSVNANEKVLVDMYWENGTTRFVAVQNGVTVLDKSYQNTKISSGYVGFGWRWNPLNGSIDLNGTYIKVNGQPWFGLCPVEVQKHRLRGPVGYTVVGSPTIVDGVLSNIGTSSNYVISDTSLSASSINGFELQSRFTYTPKTGNTQFIIVYNTKGTFVSGLRILNNDKLSWYIGRDEDNLGHQINSDITCTEGNTYWLKGVINDSVATLYYKTDNTSWTSIGTADLTGVSITFSNNPVGIGHDYSTSSGWTKFNGSIDLNHTYIKINGKLWFYQPADTKYIVKDGKLVWADQRLALGGPVNYEVVGNPTIVDGVASGFSSSNYLQMSQPAEISQVTEIVIKFNLPSSALNKNKYNFLLVAADFRIYLYSYQTYFGAAGIDIPGIGSITSTFQFQADTDYWFKYIKNNNSYTFLYSADGEQWTEGQTKTGTISPGETPITVGIRSDTLQYFDGSIDLNETYINVNGSLWFYGKNYATQNIAPVPAGFTFGTTTTPSIGYVDMRTQQFMAAPDGATIGRDE